MLKKVMNERGFTLIEMLIVLLVISILLIITIPNITKNQSTIQSKGCEAFVKMAQAQVQAYEIDNAKLPESVGELKVKAISNRHLALMGMKLVWIVKER